MLLLSSYSQWLTRPVHFLSHNVCFFVSFCMSIWKKYFTKLKFKPKKTFAQETKTNHKKIAKKLATLTKQIWKHDLKYKYAHRLPATHLYPLAHHQVNHPCPIFTLCYCTLPLCRYKFSLALCLEARWLPCLVLEWYLFDFYMIIFLFLLLIISHIVVDNFWEMDSKRCNIFSLLNLHCVAAL